MNRRIIPALSRASGLCALASAGALIYKALSIYHSGAGSGEQMYTRAAVSGAIKQIAPLLMLFFALSALTAVLRACFPEKKKYAPADSAARAYLAQKPRQKRPAALKLALFALAAALTVLGIINGGMRDVFVKAVNICTECIGLG